MVLSIVLAYFAIIAVLIVSAIVVNVVWFSLLFVAAILFPSLSRTRVRK
jgi:hypothetical protein